MKVENYDPKPDREWYIGFVADRRRRGVPVQGVIMPGEHAVRLQGDTDGPVFCSKGHALTPGTFTWRVINGYRCRECNQCRHVAYEKRLAVKRAETLAKAARPADAAHCSRGHERTSENTGLTKRGAIRCRVCEREDVAAWRKRGSPKRQPRGTHCPNGHEWTPENTYPDPRGSERCRACHLEATRRRAAERRAAAQCLA